MTRLFTRRFARRIRSVCSSRESRADGFDSAQRAYALLRSCCAGCDHSPRSYCGKMMHPYMRRRQGKEEVTYPTHHWSQCSSAHLECALSGTASTHGNDSCQLHRSGGRRTARAVGMRRSMQRMKDLEGRLRAGMARNGIGLEAQETSYKESLRSPCTASRSRTQRASR